MDEKNDQDTTRFVLSIHGISLELSGSPRFVEELYREIMRDIERVHREERAALTPVAPTPEARAPSPAPTPAVIWLHRCSELVNKVYMATEDDLRTAQVFSFLNLKHVTAMYLEDGVMRRELPQFAKGRTLWAKLTTAGRATIASASERAKPAQPAAEIFGTASASSHAPSPATRIKGESST